MNASTEDKEGLKETLLELSEVSIAQSMLVFLLCSMRVLSATGRIATNYAYLNIDSDKVGRGCADELAGYSTKETFESSGVTGAHIIAIFLLEVSREAENLENNDQSSDDAHQSEAFLTGTRYRKAASGVHVLLNYLRHFYKTDLAAEIPKVRKEEYPLDPPTKQQVAETGQRRTSFLQEVANHDDSEEYTYLPRRSRVLSMFEARQHNITNEAFTNINNHILAGAASSNLGHHTKQELKILLEQAISTRDFSRLGFLKEFFKEGSIMRMMVESKVEMVWLHDWHPMNELTYSIALDRDRKRVILSFRCMVSKADEKHCRDRAFLSTENPIGDSYVGRSKNIKLHRGFHKYLFRARQDTGTSKFDEIANKLVHYSGLLGGGTTVLVTGHSMGASLATVMSFYVSTDERFTRHGAVEAATFGASRVGGYEFADAVRYQESIGKLRVAQFCNNGDAIPKMPITSLKMSKRGAVYHTTGIAIKLPVIRKGVLKMLPQKQPKLAYLQEEPFMKSYGRQIKEFLSLLGTRQSRSHKLDEHKNRILLAGQDSSGSSPLVKYSLEEIYEMRDKF